MKLIEQYWSFLAVGVIIYLFGMTVKRFICRWWPIPASAEKVYRAHPGMRHPEVPTMRSLYDTWLPWLPVLGGFALGFVPLPIPSWVATTGDLTATIIGRCFWFGLAGAVCGQIYEGVQRAIRAKLGTKALRDSSPPAPPAADDGDADAEA